MAATTVHSFTASCPVEHQAALAECMAAQPAVTKGPILDLLQQLRSMNIPIGALLGLFPLIAAAFANPVLGLMPLLTAVAALIKQYHPTPAPA